jgi:hypothetical protein
VLSEGSMQLRDFQAQIPLVAQSIAAPLDILRPHRAVLAVFVSVDLLKEEGELLVGF